MKIGKRKIGKCKMKNGKWKRKIENGEQRMGNGKIICEIKNEKCRMGDVEWRIKNEEKIGRAHV